MCNINVNGMCLFCYYMCISESALLHYLFRIYLLIYNNMYIIILFNLRSKAPERFVYSEDTGAV